MKVLITGANGFVGRALREYLICAGHQIVPVVRKPCSIPGERVIADVANHPGWAEVLSGCQVVVHLAARVHVMNDTAGDVAALYHASNVVFTRTVAEVAALQGVKRFIFVSSIKVNGEGREIPYRAEDVPAPEDDYSRSKWAAEKALGAIAQQTGMEVVILRPPLVYGPGVRANFLRMMEVLAQGWVLPLGAVHNRRSLLYIGNLCDAVSVAMTHPAAAGHTYLPTDCEDVSTTELLYRLARALEVSPRLIPIPSRILRWAGKLLGKGRQAERLLGSLAADSSSMRRDLGWSPPFSMDEGLLKTVQWYRDHRIENETNR
jgi:nucleoside-diphosphate-sugar epimerase